jgi:hypothetical protein
MKILVIILATVALLLGAIWDNVSARKYGTLLTATLISEIIAAAGFFYLLKTSRGFLKYYSVVCVVLCLLIVADAIRRLLA